MVVDQNGTLLPLHVMGGMNTHEVLEDIGFELRPSTAGALLPPDDANLVADRFFDFVCSLIAERLLSHLAHSLSLPGFFAGLVADDGATRGLTLDELSIWWRRLQELEAAAYDNPFLETVWQDLWWPRFQFCRWVLLALAEVDFQSIPQSVRHRLRGWASTWSSTKVVEDAFHLLRAEENRSENSKLSATSLWACCLRSELTVQNKREQIAPVEAADATATPLPSNFFKSTGGVPSLPTHQFGAFLKATSYRTPSPAHWQKVPLLWHAILHVAPDYAQLEDCWKSMLLMPGTLVVGPGDISGLVLHNSVYCAVLLRLGRWKVCTETLEEMCTMTV